MSDNPRLAIPWMQIGAAVGVLVFLGTLVTFLTGGLKPQWQTDIAELRASNVGLAADLKTAVAKFEATQQASSVSAASDKAVLTARIDAATDLFNSRLNAMWRPSDYADRDSHLARLDTVYDLMRDRVTNLEYLTKDIDKRVQGFSSAPVRNPGR